MAFTSFSDYVVRMRSELPQCSDAIILQEIQKAAIEFFGDTGVWVVELTAQDIVANQTAYTFTLPSSTQMYQLVGLKLRDTSTTAFDTLSFQDPASYRVNALQTGIEFVTGNVPSTSVTGGMQFTMMLQPNWDSTTCPSAYLNRYARAIMARAKYNLMSMSRKPWSDPQSAQRYLGIYDSEMAVAVSDAYTGNMAGSLDMIIPSI